METRTQGAKRAKKDETPGNEKAAPAPGSGEEISLEESIFSNYLLLREIFKHSDLKDLKSHRQINRLFYIEATTILLQRFKLKAIALSKEESGFSIEDESFQPGDEFPHEVKFEEFLNLVSKSRMFPCWNFYLADDPQSRGFQTFFQDHGSIVKKLDYSPKKVKTNDVILLAAKYLPNLEILYCTGNLSSPFKEDINVDDTIKIPKVHTLKFVENFPINVISKMLTVANNVKHVYMTSSLSYKRELKKFLELNAIRQLSDIQIVLDKSGLEIFERVLKQNPRFEKFKVVCADPTLIPVKLSRAGNILTKIFEKCSESLTRISRLYYLSFVHNLKIPVLPKVHRLGIQYCEDGIMKNQNPLVIKLLPVGQNAGVIFPNLKKLDVSFKAGHDLRIIDIFPASTTPLLSVKTLLLYEDAGSPIPATCIKQLCTLLPNMTCANVSWIADEAFEFVFGLRHLRSLELTIQTGEEIESFPGLDSAFTGFSQETVRQLQENQVGQFDLSTAEIEAMRVKPSIADLKDLIQLKITLKDEGLHEDTVWYDNSPKQDAIVVAFSEEGSRDVLNVDDRIILSYATKVFGFDMCPKLRSNVEIYIRKYKTFRMPAQAGQDIGEEVV